MTLLALLSLGGTGILIWLALLFVVAAIIPWPQQRYALAVAVLLILLYIIIGAK